MTNLLHGEHAYLSADVLTGSIALAHTMIEDDSWTSEASAGGITLPRYARA